MPVTSGAFGKSLWPGIRKWYTSTYPLEDPVLRTYCEALAKYLNESRALAMRVVVEFPVAAYHVRTLEVNNVHKLDLLQEEFPKVLTNLMYDVKDEIVKAGSAPPEFGNTLFLVPNTEYIESGDCCTLTVAIYTGNQ